MEKDKKKTKFLRQPEYPGGNKALAAFVYAQLRYPKLALEAGTEGIVYLEYDIDYLGNVTATRILQGLGQGCDEEAARVVRLLRFGVPPNRGLRVIFHRKIKIQFKKPVPVPMPAAPKAQAAAVQIQYQYVATTVTPAEPKAGAKEVYTYKIG